MEFVFCLFKFYEAAAAARGKECSEIGNNTKPLIIAQNVTLPCT